MYTDKQLLRKWAKEERKKLNISEISKKIVEKLELLEEYKQAENVMLFYPLNDEINLLSILKNKSKKFYLPKIDGENLLCCPYSEGDETCLSCFKTCEPVSEPCEKSLIDIVIVPALACDGDNYRLGYGGGFYDRFLKDFRGTKIVCLPKALIVKTVFPEEFDIKADIVITD